MSVNHYARAEELLAKAAEHDNTTRHTYAKSLAAMALAHAHLAQTKAVRQQTELLAELVGIMRPDVVVREAAPELSMTEFATVTRFDRAPDALADACPCKTGARGDICPEHDQPLDLEVK